MNSQRSVRLINGMFVLCLFIFVPHVIVAQDGSAESLTAKQSNLDASRQAAETPNSNAEEASQQPAREYSTEAADGGSTIHKAALEGCEMHVVGLYMPKNHSKDDRIYVDVKPTGNPMVLVLTGYFGAEWHLNIDPQADVRQIIVPGYYKHEIADPVPDLPVCFLTYFPKADKKNESYFWAYAWHTAEGRELRKKLKELTGLEVTTFQGEYAATQFIVDGDRGRDIVEGKEPSSKVEESSGGFLSSLFGGAKAAAEPAQPTAGTSPVRATPLNSKNDSNYGNLESQRTTALDLYNMAEEASQQAAREYRTEAAQESPDAKALAGLKQKLNAAVKAAFEAQMSLQQVRLQIAQRDLADVQAKHRRRESLASKIIERRVADLMDGEDLGWPQAKVPEEFDLPRFNGQTIDYWLLAYRVLKEQSIQNDALAEVMAIKALQNDPSSDRFIQSFLARQWEITKTEVNKFHAGQKLASMIEIGGPRHSKILLDYLLQLSARMTETTDFHDLELKDSWGLKPAAEKLSIWTEESAEQIAEELQNGNSKQRLGAIAVLSSCLMNIALAPDVGQETQLIDNKAFGDMWGILTLSLIEASRDDERDVRSLAVMLASVGAHSVAEGTDESLRGRLKEMIESDPDEIARENARSLLAEQDNTSDLTNAGDQPPDFATPQELIDYVEMVGDDNAEVSVEHYVELLTDDEVKRFSGFLLRTHSTLKAVAGLMATFGSSDPDGDAFDVMSLTTALGLSIEKHRLSDPPPAAESAYQQISEGFNVLQLFSPSPPKPAIDADVYSNLLRMASGVLKDPKAFLRDAMTGMKALAKNSEKKDDAASKPNKPAEWQVTVDGDTATAVNIAAEIDEPEPLGMAQTMELVKVGKTWKISSIFPDRVIIEIQQGMTARSSTSNPSDNSDGEPQPPVSRSYPEPVEHIVGTNAAVAKSDIRAYSELSDSNVTIAVGHSDEKKTSALSKGSVVGKYLNRHLKMGEEITAEMLIDKPTTEQSVDFWLGEAAAGRGVFEPIRFPNSPPPNSNLYATNYPFKSTYAESFNKKLPEWTDAYLRMLTRQLSATHPESWTTPQENLIRSVGELVHYQQANWSHDLAEFGELLSKFVILNSNKETAHADAHVRKFSHSVVVLAELARIKGSLPAHVLTTVPDDPETAAKLKLIKQLAENNAEWLWVHQEHLRLAGILEQAPIQALSLVLTVAPIKSADHLDQWIFAMSDVETYRAHRSSPPRLFAPPIDAVLLIAVADLLAGKQQHTDDNLAMVFDQPGSGSGRTMFNEDASDILEGDLAYRASVLKSLVSIYRKSKSESLKTNIARLAPAVPVMAAKDSPPATSATPPK